MYKLYEIFLALEVCLFFFLSDQIYYKYSGKTLTKYIRTGLTFDRAPVR